MSNEFYFSTFELEKFVISALKSVDVNEGVSQAVANVLIHASLRGVDSHGVRLLPHYIRGVQQGRINPNPSFKFHQTSASTALLDGDHTFGHAAALEAAKKAVLLAKEAGTGHVAVFNSSHFGPASYYALEIAKSDIIGISLTHSDALLKTPKGKRAFLGNNPICIAAPTLNEEPFCLDMATSVITFNKVRQYAEEKKTLPNGVAADEEGRETKDAASAKTLIPIADYKGFGLSMAVEIFCSLLTGMNFGPDIPKMFEAPMNKKRKLGHFVSAYRIDCFQSVDFFKQRLQSLMDRLRAEPRVNESDPILVPGDPEKKIQSIRCKQGIPLSELEYRALADLAHTLKLKFPS